MEQVRNAAGDVIAWVRDSGCEADACIAAAREGFPVHLIPAHTDPRAAEASLAMPFYHFQTAEQAVTALERAWATARTAATTGERDEAYRRHQPVKILKGAGRDR